VSEQDEVAAFFASHCSTPGGVIVVEVWADGERQQTGIFRSFDKAMAWRDRFGDDGAAIFSPYVLDEPDFGNVPADSLN
jgi:hypothetical protein